MKYLYFTIFIFVCHSMQSQIVVNGTLRDTSFTTHGVYTKEIKDRPSIKTEIDTIEDTAQPFWVFYPWFDKTITYIINFLNNNFKI